MRRPIDRQAVGSLAEQLRDATPQELLTWVAEKCSGKVAFASAMGLEDQVLVHMIAESGLDIPVFTLDTGR
ncbi:MAG: phosphoadenylyl-sulfate reductase, partial [Lentisphaeria bacterium]|nr:phosphoadenylyl-sulfate reductase [Lentisphaeria bacterium]